MLILYAVISNLTIYFFKILEKITKKVIKIKKINKRTL
jgi:hypothetical protein